MYKSISINKNKSVNILDQRLLPFQHKYIKTSDYKEVIKLIKSLAIRNPLIKLKKLDLLQSIYHGLSRDLEKLS